MKGHAFKKTKEPLKRVNHKGKIKFSRTNYSTLMPRMTYYKPWVVEMERFWHLVCENLTSFKFFSFFFLLIFLYFFLINNDVFIDKVLRVLMNYPHTIRNSTFGTFIPIECDGSQPRQPYFLDQKISCCKFKKFWRKFANFFLNKSF